MIIFDIVSTCMVFDMGLMTISYLCLIVVIMGHSGKIFNYCDFTIRGSITTLVFFFKFCFENKYIMASPFSFYFLSNKYGHFYKMIAECSEIYYRNDI